MAKVATGSRASVTQDALFGAPGPGKNIQSALESGRRFGMSPDWVKGPQSAGTMGQLRKSKDIGKQVQYAEAAFKASIRKGFSNPSGVAQGLSPQFAWALNTVAQGSPYGRLAADIQAAIGNQIKKGFTLSNPLSSGLVPFDLVAPTMLIYPVYSPLRNRFPRPIGQGTSHRAKVLTDILGALPGNYANSAQRVSISELPSGGSLTNWPNQLPGMGSQTAVDVNVPYKFFGLTEAVSWLSQFAGQGFDDLAALASLVLLQEMLLAEERAIIGSTGLAITAPGKPTVVARTAGSNETALTSVTTNIYVVVTAVNYYGETVASTATSLAVSSGQVADVTISPSAGALA